jgi:hypothetical protein
MPRRVPHGGVVAPAAPAVEIIDREGAEYRDAEDEDHVAVGIVTKLATIRTRSRSGCRHRWRRREPLDA